MALAQTISSQALTKIVTWRNFESTEPNWGKDSTAITIGHPFVGRVIASQLPLALITLSSLVEIAAYGAIFGVAYLAKNTSLKNKNLLLLDSGLTTTILALKNTLLNPFKKNLTTHESYYRQQIDLDGDKGFFRIIDQQYIASQTLPLPPPPKFKIAFEKLLENALLMTRFEEIRDMKPSDFDEIDLHQEDEAIRETINCLRNATSHELSTDFSKAGIFLYAKEHSNETLKKKFKENVDACFSHATIYTKDQISDAYILITCCIRTNPDNEDEIRNEILEQDSSAFQYITFKLAYYLVLVEPDKEIPSYLDVRTRNAIKQLRSQNPLPQ